MKALLITGAGGFVGQHALAYAAEHYPNVDVWACTREKKPDYQIDNDHLRWVEIDMLNAPALDDLIRKVQPDAVMHLAAASSVGYSWQYPRDSTLNNLNIYLNLLEAVRHYSPKARILSVGSSEVYGQVKAEALPLQEDYAFQPASPYGVARASQEALSNVYVDGYGLDIVLTRSFNHFGPGQDSRFALPSFARQIAVAKNAGQSVCHLKVGNVDVIRDFTDVRDVVNAYFSLIKKGKKGEIYNICSSQGRSLREVIQTMADIAGVKADIETNSELVRPQDLPVVYGDNSKIKRDINWTPEIEFSTTVQNVIEEWLSRENPV